MPLLRLTPLKTVLLFIPFILSAILGRIPNSTLQTFLHTYYILDSLFTLNFLLLVGCQSYFLIKFDAAVVKKLAFFKVNALVPVLYVGYWFIRGIYLSVTKPNYPALDKPESGPITMVAYTTYDTIIALLLIYSLITFFFVNNNYVASRIKKENDLNTQNNLRSQFLTPMKLIVRGSWIAVIIMIVLTFVNDVLAIFQKAPL